MLFRLIAFFRSVNTELAALDDSTRAAIFDFINDSTL